MENITETLMMRELSFILNTGKPELIEFFNDDVECFSRYVELQAGIFERAGYCNAAGTIRQKVKNARIRPLR